MDDLLDTYVRLKADGIVPHACLDHGMTMSFYYVDPDGNSVEAVYRGAVASSAAQHTEAA